MTFRVSIKVKGMLMKKYLIFLSILIIAFIAFFDTKGRIEELDEIAANTPSQVEMNQMMNKPKMQSNTESIKNYNTDNPENLHEKMQRDSMNNMQNQLDNVNKRRDTINN